MPCAYSGCNGFINKLRWLENGLRLWLDALLHRQRNNQSGQRVAFCGWCVITTHPWNMLSKFYLFHPWKFHMFCHFDCMLASWLQNIFDPFQSFKVCIIFGVLESLDGLPQFVVCINNGIRWCIWGWVIYLWLQNTVSAKRLARVFLVNTTCVL